ncbi:MULTISPECIES: accessory gene regulator B family protein [Paenibacillus]|uniref:accessory gene regulator B family protein n=1 Tax=Paenibacillus TaxID=44249 RepID=UPI0020CA24A3|nr:accessory gene regulator B family protein [Paenibacillus amylolyticus]
MNGYIGLYSLNISTREVINIQEQAAVHISLTESLASKIALWINKEREGEHIQYLKMKLGIETLLINITKSVLVYGLALLLNMLMETLIVHATYYAVRRISFGLHASTSFRCSMISIILFVGLPYICSYIMINNYMVLITGMISVVLLYRYAPADTDKFPLLGVERRKKLRKASVRTAAILTLIALLCPIHTVKTLMMAGMLLQIISILPVTYKILKRSVRNYEKYETDVVGRI